MHESQKLRKEIVAVVNRLPLDGLRLLAEFVELLQNKFKLTPSLGESTGLPATNSELDHGRALMRQLGQGLGEGKPPHDAAKNHDLYLYNRDSV